MPYFLSFPASSPFKRIHFYILEGRRPKEFPQSEEKRCWRGRCFLQKSKTGIPLNIPVPFSFDNCE